MDAKEFDGKDLDDAIGAAAAAMDISASEVDYEIVEGGRKGVFGLGARPVRIRVVSAGNQPAAPRGAAEAPAAARAPERQQPPAFSAPGAAMRDIIAKMGFDLRIDEARHDGTLELTLDGADRKRLTAKDGELLAALEFVLHRMGRRGWPDEPPVRVACRGFRSERDDELVDMVREAAAQVASSGLPRRLQAMNPYQRRVVHMTVREHPGLTTVSEGDGFLKCVRVEKIAP